MFVRAFTLVLAMAACAIAAPGGTFTPTPINASECDTSNLQCCNQTQTAGSSTAEQLGLLGLDVPLTGLLGTDCTPINVLGLGSGGQCTQQPVCCTDVTQNGLVNVGCTPVVLGL